MPATSMDTYGWGGRGCIRRGVRGSRSGTWAEWLCEEVLAKVAHRHVV